MKKRSIRFDAQRDIRKDAREEKQRRKLRRPAAPLPIFTGAKRTSAVNAVMDLMRDWRFTPFEREGVTVAGLRSALCLSAYEWQRADVAANDLVAEALRLLGAKRPKWEEGQREYTEARDLCRWCRGSLPDGHSSLQYCSPECARMAIARRDFEARSLADKAYRQAMEALTTLAAPVTACETCGKRFRSRHKGARYCSRRCSGAVRRTIPDHCCLYCGTAFRTDQRTSLYCAPACQYAGFRFGLRRGHRNVLTPPIFDAAFALAA